jgi:dienelactone hydrolase
MLRPPHAVCILLAILLTGCATLPTPDERRLSADITALKQRWQAQIISTDHFPLMTYVPTQWIPADALTVYIEGDGLAWIRHDLPSHDPTPLRPIGLQLALAQPSGNAAYMARACQFTQLPTTECPQSYWTTERFSSDVIDTSNRVLDQLKQQFRAKQLTLVGYSGGAAIALLLAARRDDIRQVITVAGNVDHAAWTHHHQISPLTGSLNPASYISQLIRIPQVHFVGQQDTVIPPFLAKKFIQAFNKNVHIHILEQSGFTHQCCWVEQWPSLWQQAQTVSNNQ